MSGQSVKLETIPQSMDMRNGILKSSSYQEMLHSNLLRKVLMSLLTKVFWEKKQRVKMRKRIEALGAKEVLYYLDTPIETIRERIVGRNVNLTKESFKISREMLDNYLKYWQPPSEDEDYVLASEVK